MSDMSDYGGCQFVFLFFDVFEIENQNHLGFLQNQSCFLVPSQTLLLLSIPIL
jgi:hypothetical protein